MSTYICIHQRIIKSTLRAGESVSYKQHMFR